VTFCTACGAELKRAGGVSLERKIVTAVFVDVVGFTSLAETLDPEEIRSVLGPYYARVRELLERYGGTVEKFIGDAVMALFGAPTAHEDDAERAVRAACAVLEAVTGLRTDDGSPGLRVRIGIATGDAVVSVSARPVEGDAMAHGDVVNTASRLQSGAPAGGILVDERTYRTTRFQISFRSVPPLHAKGKAEPVRAWAVVAPRGRLGTDVRRHRRALIGRAREVEVLTGMLEQAHAGRKPRIATLTGPPGIGKSRLVWELFQLIDRRPEMIFWRQGRSLPYGDGVTFWALAEIVKGHAGILATDDRATVEEKLRIAIEDVVTDANEARWIESHLAPLAGLAQARELRGDNRIEAFTAWRRFLEAIAARSPLIVVFEDMHWADDAMLEFVSEYLDERFDGPLLVVATCRPELFERKPGWGGGANGRTVVIEPLSDEDTARLVAELLETQDLPAKLRAALLASAGGNPLYAEEYVRLLLDRGVLRQAGAGLELAGETLPLPDSIHAIVASRLDALPPDEKMLIRDAAVVGKAFWLGAVEAIGTHQRWSVEHHLHELERKQFVRRERDSVVRSEPQYSFSHVIIRDVAYEQLPRSLRSEKHRRAADWLESLSPERSEDRAEMLADHYLKALRHAPSEPERDALTQRARIALRDAGDRSLALNAFAKASEFYAEALSLWPAEAEGRAELVFHLGNARFHSEGGGDELLEQARDLFLDDGRLEKAAEAMVLLGELLWMRGHPGTFDHLEKAADLLADAPASYSKAYVMCSLARFNMIRDHNDEAIEVGLQALEMVDQLRIADLRGHALASVGLARARIGDPRGIADLEESVSIAVTDNSLESVRAYANLGNALVEAGELLRAFELYQQGRDAAARFGDADRIRWFEVERMYECYWQGRWDEAVALSDEIVAEVGAGFPTAFEQDARLVRGRIRFARDEASAEEDSARALELGEHAGYPELLVPALALQARVLASTGRPDEAAALADRLLQIWPARCPTSYWVADFAFALHDLGRSRLVVDAAASVRPASRWLEAGLAVASGEFARAAEVYAAIGSLPDEAIARLGAARSASAQQLRDRVEAELAPSLSTFRALCARRYVREAEELLALPA
jgi:class 3 adenylate cyclase/tetratricopeptide (TPR) repeat protein